ncbi:MAG: sigma-70 family RNA polymerase sigma factor [Acidimicrobiia bacterium]|nr:sigma-70 family RNA polymerase sigma factor [Acidimicrobiia bacterium]
MEGRQGGAAAPRAEPSLSALYDSHYKNMVRLASMYLDQREAAEEVVQDAFVKLLKGKYRIAQGAEAAYLRRMVVNGAHSALRKRRVRRRHAVDEVKPVAAAEDEGVDRSERERILHGIRQLPKNQAAVIVLRYYLDLSEAEIAETLGIARGSVKSHAHRGLARLQKILGPQAGRQPKRDAADSEQQDEQQEVSDGLT